MLRKMSKRISRVVLPSGKMQVKNPHFVACDRSDALQLPGFVCSYQLIYELIPSCSDLEMSWSCNDEAITVTGKKRWLAPKLYIRAHVPYIFYMVAHIPWILTHSGTYSTRTHIYIYKYILHLKECLEHPGTSHLTQLVLPNTLQGEKVWRVLSILHRRNLKERGFWYKKSSEPPVDVLKNLWTMG